MRLKAAACEECDTEIVPGAMIPLCGDCYDKFFCEHCDAEVINGKCEECTEFEEEI